MKESDAQYIYPYSLTAENHFMFQQFLNEFYYNKVSFGYILSEYYVLKSKNFDYLIMVCLQHVSRIQFFEIRPSASTGII